MKNLKKNFVHHTYFGQFVGAVYYWMNTRLTPPKTYVKRQYKKAFGLPLNLKNPQTLNEKLQWLKLNEKDPRQIVCSDKFKVRDFVKEKIGEEYLVPLIFATKNLADLTPENFPEYPVIIKTNHDSSGGVIVMDKRKVDWSLTKKHFKHKLGENYYYPSKEWQYKQIEKRIIVEQLLVGTNGEIPFDYKIHCFNGKAEVIQVDIDRFIDHKRNIYFPNWKLAPFTWSTWENEKILWNNGKEIEKPIKLELMLQLAEKLSADFDYVRVDFYICDDQIYFGELTFYHGGGLERIIPKEWDLKLGEKLVLKTKA